MLPKKGTVFPGQSDRRKARLEYASLVAKAMRSELGGTHQAIKTVMRWTGAGERTVKNWFNAEKGPSGAYLLRLIHESDGVLLAVLRASGRDDVVGAIGRGIVDNRRSTTDFRQGALSSVCDPFRSGEQGVMQNQENDSENVPDNVPKNVPDRNPAFDRGRDTNTLRTGPAERAAALVPGPTGHGNEHQNSGHRTEMGCRRKDRQARFICIEGARSDRVRWISTNRTL